MNIFQLFKSKISIKSSTWYMCTKSIKPYEKGIVYLGADIDPSIKLWFKYFREATQEEIDEQHPKPEPTPEPTPEPEPDYSNDVLWYLEKFAPEIKVPKDSTIFQYLIKLYTEAYNQYYKDKSEVLPVLLREKNFPNLYNYYGNAGSEEAAFKTLVGWLFALVLAELKPKNRARIFKIGYEMGGYDKYSCIYGYQFRCDPNNMRIVANVLYVAMRGLFTPDSDKMREEVGGSKYDKTLGQLKDDDRNNVDDYAFYTDFRLLLPTAPGPYAPGYTSRPDNTYPNEEKDEYKNLKVDRTIYEMIVKTYNLSSEEYYRQMTVQAIADKEADRQHLFGDNKQAGEFHFHPVFGVDTIGVRISPSSPISSLVDSCLNASSKARGIMQSASVTPKQYGRLRPGCSWTQEAVKHSKTDDRLNVLANFTIEDNDGCPTGYYDQNGKWVYPATCDSPEEYEEMQKNNLYANSYPSGHSSGIMGGAMVLIELMPTKADLILKAANGFAINRTMARYHWTSDTINGRVLGGAQNAVCHAAKDYEAQLSYARKDLAIW